MHKKIIKNLLLTFTVIGIFLQFATYSNALTITSREDLSFDNKLADQVLAVYQEPEKILISNITTQSQALAGNSDLWVQALYYYSITRLGFADIPYNYLIDRNGEIYQGRLGWLGVNPELSDQSPAVLIGYLSNANDITPAAQRSFNDLMSDISKKYAITKENVQVVDLSIESNSTSTEETASAKGLSKLSYQVSSQPFASNFLPVISLTTFYNTKQSVEYNGSVAQVVSAGEVKSGENLAVTVTLQNNNDFPWYTDNDFIYVTTTSGKNSQYAINGEWDNFSKPTHIEDEIILPGESVEVQFNLYANYYPIDNAKESFRFVILPDKIISGTDFDVIFNITQGAVSYVRIAQTEAGVLNVRNCNYIECAITDQVPSGGVYPILEESNGWYKISYGDGLSGWVGSLYAEKI